jgi:enamine deaminase RidA (YjgF/YER057c/UK114 family)
MTKFKAVNAAQVKRSRHFAGRCGMAEPAVVDKRDHKMKPLTPAAIRPPFARYSHGVELPAGQRLVFCSGQLGIAADGTIPESPRDQADLCFANIAAILGEAGMTLANIVRVNAYVTDRAHMKGYMESRDAHVGTPPPASTLMIVSGFTLPEFKVEIEVVAAAPEKRRKTARSTSAPKF